MMVKTGNPPQFRVKIFTTDRIRSLDSKIGRSSYNQISLQEKLNGFPILSGIHETAHTINKIMNYI